MAYSYDQAYQYAKQQGSKIAYAPNDPAEVQHLTDWYAKEQAKLQRPQTFMGDDWTPPSITGNFFTDPNVLGSTWEGNQQRIHYRDGTTKLNPPYEESYGVGGFLGDVTKYAALAGVTAGAGYVGGGMAGLWGAPAAGAGTSGLTAAEAGALGTEGFTGLGGAGGSGLMGGVPGYTGAGLTAAQIAAIRGVGSAAGAQATAGITGGTLTAGGLTALQKMMLAQQGINAIGGIAGNLAGGGGAVPTGGYGADNYGAGTGGGLLSYNATPSYIQQQQPKIDLAGLKKQKTWQDYAEEAKQNQKDYYGGYLA
uniref:Uncharacterized protein n=1 Tax=viral metagenome TaxID=1070528 RepID=A0A6M3XMZ6_9ZZZZ